MDQDIRRFPRLASRHSVLVNRLSNEPAEGFARTTTLTRGGCGFISDDTYGVDSRVKLLIAIDHRVVTVIARVVYERPAADGSSEIGVEFLELDPSDAEAIQRVLESPPVAAE